MAGAAGRRGRAFFGVGVWAAARIGGHDLWAGLGVLLAAAVLALLVAAPGVYTLRHREQAGRFFAASRVRGDVQAGAHPYLAAIGYLVAGALAGALLGRGHQTTTSREVWAVIGAVLGLVLAIARIRRGRQRLHNR